MPGVRADVRQGGRAAVRLFMWSALHSSPHRHRHELAAWQAHAHAAKGGQALLGVVHGMYGVSAKHLLIMEVTI